MPVSEIAEVEVMADSRSRGYGSGQHHASPPTGTSYIQLHVEQCALKDPETSHAAHTRWANERTPTLTRVGKP